MLWYWSDWFSGTSTMSRFLKGCYMDVLHAQFNEGRLSLEEIRTVLGSDFGQAWPTIQKKFAVDEAGKYFNKRLELEKKKRAAYTASRRKNLESVHMDTHMNQLMIPHMDNINRNDNELKDKKESKEEISEQLFNDEIFIEQLAMTHKGKDLKQAFEECYTHHINAQVPPEDAREWKQKLNTWLINTKNANRTGNKGTIRRADATTEKQRDFGKL